MIEPPMINESSMVIIGSSNPTLISHEYEICTTTSAKDSLYNSTAMQTVFSLFMFPSTNSTAKGISSSIKSSITKTDPNLFLYVIN